MRSFVSGKFWIGFLSLLGLVALTALALGMRSMSFEDAQAIRRGEEAGSSTFSVVRVLANAVTSVPFQNQLIFIVLIALFVILISLLMSPEGRKRMLRMLFRVAVTYIIVYLLITRYPEVLEQIGLSLTQPASEAPAPLNTAPPTFTPPDSVNWLSYLISFGLATVLVFGAWKFYTIWRELNSPVSDETRKRLGTIARTSLHDLSSGGNSTDVILGCYYRMSEVVLHNKQLDRRASMTPAEFAARLEAAGLPSDAVRQLTGLFESVRYGGYKSSPKMVNEAVACLTTILNHCGEAA